MKNQRILKLIHLNLMRRKLLNLTCTANKINQNKIFNSFIKKNLKKISFAIKKNDTGEIKYLPPVSKEWKNTIYSFNKNNTKNIPINNINLNKIIKFYFNLFFKNNKFIGSKNITLKKRRSSIKNIFISKPEIKHTHNKAIITLYTINLKKNILYNTYIMLIANYIKNIVGYSKHKFNYGTLRNIFFEKFILNNFFLIKEKEYEKFRLKFFLEFIEFYTLFIKLYLTEIIKTRWNKNLIFIKGHKYIYYLNKYKFEKNIFLIKLSNILSKILNKKIEYNIVNLKSLTYNTDIFTNVLALKLKKQKYSVFVVNTLNSILYRAKFPDVNTIIERARIIKNIDPNSLINKYKDLNLISNLEGYSFNKFLKKVFNHNVLFSKEKENKYSKKKIENNNSKIHNLIFNSINYKNMAGIRLEARGRLTKRYRADRAVYKLKWRGGLKNIDSSFRGLSSVLYRGYLEPNVNYSIATAKRRVGAFSVKGWISGK